MRFVLLLLAVTVVGCTGDSRPKPVAPPFRIDVPKSLEVLNGLTIQRDVPVVWEPGEREDLDVTVAVEPDGKGVSATAEPGHLERGAGPIQLLVRASETADPGDYTLTLTAKAAKSGVSAKGTVAVKVPRKD